MILPQIIILLRVASSVSWLCVLREWRRDLAVSGTKNIGEGCIIQTDVCEGKLGFVGVRRKVNSSSSIHPHHSSSSSMTIWLSMICCWNSDFAWRDDDIRKIERIRSHAIVVFGSNFCGGSVDFMAAADASPSAEWQCRHLGSSCPPDNKSILSIHDDDDATTTHSSTSWSLSSS